MLASGGRVEVDICPKTDSPPLPLATSRAGAFIERVGGYMQKQHSHLWQSFSNCSSAVWAAASWLFQVQLVFSCRVPFLKEMVCFRFFEVNSQNCGSSCSGYSLVIMYLTSSTWCFSISKTTYRMWLRKLSIAIEKEWKALDNALGLH